MSNLTYEEYKIIHSFIKEKSTQLINHEKKEYSQVGFPIDNYMLFPINGKSYYRIATNIFISIIDHSIIKIATEQCPELFGTGNSKDVIKAIYLATEETLPELFLIYKNRLEEFEEFIKNAHCYIVEHCKHNLTKKILRIDLFRKMDKNKKQPDLFEFTGGLLHSFKHFSINKVNLSINKDIVEIFHPIRMIDYLVVAFFGDNEKNETNKGFTTAVEFNENYNLFISFYKEINTEVYFLNTAYKKEKHDLNPKINKTKIKLKS